MPDNPLGLPAFPYELAYAIQDRMFTDKGALFYPAFPGDPFYDDFITGEGAVLPPELFPGGGPTALAEFFGDHMVVNGKIWPKANVEPRNYRMRLLNGTDSRFMALQFVAVNVGDTDFTNAGPPIPFWVIGSDQGLGTPAQSDTLVFEPGARYDIVFDFSDPALDGKRVIMKNIGGDEPFGGDIPGPQVFGETDRIMAFDVVVPKSGVPDTFNPNNLSGYGGVPNGAITRRVALFEGTDEFGRLQPLLGTVKDGDLNTNNVATAYTWFQSTTENPGEGDTEIWEIYNFTADAHPIHLHLVNFQILDRKDFKYDITGTQTTTQHNGTTGEAPEISNIRNLTAASVGPEYFEAAPKDMVTSLPGDPEGSPPTGQMVRIKAHFNKPGRYVWHCHILSHEDHEMMRVLQVGPNTAPTPKIGVAETSSGKPATYALEQNYPNPFNPSTNIRFQIPNEEHVELKIFNILGREVRTLANKRFQAGQHTLVWNGKDKQGKPVASGIYFYRISAGGFVRIKRMSLLK